MVIINYQSFIHDKITQQLSSYEDSMLKKSLSSKQFEELVIKLYQYCEQLNIIKRRIEKLKFYTNKNQLIMPKLIDSQIIRIDKKAKEISTAYSLFLIKQRKFRVFSNQSKFYQEIYQVITKLSVQKCFAKEDAEHLTKQVNRLFRTNTFNTKNCWKTFTSTFKPSNIQKKEKGKETNFRLFRRSVYSQSSQIKPYVNNKTCFKSLKSRSPVISLWHPNNEFLSFSLAKKQNLNNSNKFQL